MDPKPNPWPNVDALHFDHLRLDLSIAAQHEHLQSHIFYLVHPSACGNKRCTYQRHNSICSILRASITRSLACSYHNFNFLIATILNLNDCTIFILGFRLLCVALERRHRFFGVFNDCLNSSSRSEYAK